MSLFWGAMNDLQEQMGQLNQELGNPFSCTLSLRGPEDLTDKKQDRETIIAFVPNPTVIEIFQNEETLENTNIKGQVRRFKVTGLAKKYDRSYFDRQNTDFVLEFQGKTLICSLVEVKEHAISWELTLEEAIAQQQLPYHRTYDA